MRLSSSNGAVNVNAERRSGNGEQKDVTGSNPHPSGSPRTYKKQIRKKIFRLKIGGKQMCQVETSRFFPFHLSSLLTTALSPHDNLTSNKGPHQSNWAEMEKKKKQKQKQEGSSSSSR